MKRFCEHNGELVDRAWRGLLLGLMTLFVVNIGLMMPLSRWFRLPDAGSVRGCRTADRDLVHGGVEGVPAGRCAWVTVQVVLSVVFLALLIGASPPTRCTT